LLYGLLAWTAFGCAKPELQVQETTSDGGGVGSDLAGVHCVSGDACSTGSPGACGDGHVDCSTGSAVCVPDATTQSCYTGPAGTKGVGVCAAGTQTCISSLGACGGEIVPAAAENCFNDLDDDCDGKVNNGCPDHLTTGTPVALNKHGNQSGGGAFSLRCPANSYVTKIVVYGDNTDAYIAGVDIACATPTLVRGASSYTVTPTAVTASPNTQRAGNITTSVNDTFDCGTASFNPGWYVPGYAESTGLDDLGMSCAAGALTLSATNQLTISFTKGPNTGSYGYNFGTAFEDDCGANQVLIGFDGRSGNWFDEIQPVCAPLQVVYK
jgi:hypothetical protein